MLAAATGQQQAAAATGTQQQQQGCDAPSRGRTPDTIPPPPFPVVQPPPLVACLVGHVEEGEVVLGPTELSNRLPLLLGGVHSRGVVGAACQQGGA